MGFKISYTQSVDKSLEAVDKREVINRGKKLHTGKPCYERFVHRVVHIVFYSFLLFLFTLKIKLILKF